mmetsp:Transcript_98765/g.247539  ORF Transcript_98765/g.247539 Transcript_98765/m.247539 type:complete len:373 (+) Transcript_98765:2227-3345(+)
MVSEEAADGGLHLPQPVLRPRLLRRRVGAGAAADAFATKPPRRRAAPRRGLLRRQLPLLGLLVLRPPASSGGSRQGRRGLGLLPPPLPPGAQVVLEREPAHEEDVDEMEEDGGDRREGCPSPRRRDDGDLHAHDEAHPHGELIPLDPVQEVPPTVLVGPELVVQESEAHGKDHGDVQLRAHRKRQGRDEEHGRLPRVDDDLPPPAVVDVAARHESPDAPDALLLEALPHLREPEEQICRGHEDPTQAGRGADPRQGAVFEALQARGVHHQELPGLPPLAKELAAQRPEQLLRHMRVGHEEPDHHNSTGLLDEHGEVAVSEPPPREVRCDVVHREKQIVDAGPIGVDVSMPLRLRVVDPRLLKPLAVHVPVEV